MKNRISSWPVWACPSFWWCCSCCRPLSPPALIAVLSAIGTYEALHAIGMNHPRISLDTAIIALAIPFWVYFGEPRRIGLLVLLIYLVAVFAEAFASHLRVKIDKE